MHLTAYGHTMRATIHQWTGIPVSIGIAPTKTLAKLANRLAKRSPEAQGVVTLTSASEMEATLAQTPIEDHLGHWPRVYTTPQSPGYHGRPTATGRE